MSSYFRCDSYTVLTDTLLITQGLGDHVCYNLPYTNNNMLNLKLHPAAVYYAGRSLHKHTQHYTKTHTIRHCTLVDTKQTRQLLQLCWPVTLAGFCLIKSVGCQLQGLSEKDTPTSRPRRKATAAGLSESLARLFDKPLKHVTAIDLIQAYILIRKFLIDSFHYPSLAEADLQELVCFFVCISA